MAKESVAVVVAHPDDEILAFGLLRAPTITPSMQTISRACGGMRAPPRQCSV
jgi:hypothetical protein